MARSSTHRAPRYRPLTLPGAILAGLLALPAAQAAIIPVKPGESIQAAIDKAQPGDVVEVQRGRYEENLRIEKTITLRGINRPRLRGLVPAIRIVQI